MNSGKVNQIPGIDGDESQTAAQGHLNKMLMPFSGGLPYDPERYQSEINMLYAMRVIAKFEVGRRLIVMWEQERRKGLRTFAEFIEKYFPDLPRQRAYEDMQYAVIAEKNPLFRQFAEGKGNMSKAITLMGAMDAEAWQEFDKTGEILGIPLDDLDKMSHREMKKRIRKLEEGQQDAIDTATHKLQADCKTLADKVLTLEAQVAAGERPVDKAIGLMKEAEKKFFDAFALLQKVPLEIIVAERVAYDVMVGTLGLAERVAGNLLADVSVAGAGHMAARDEEGGE